MNKAASKIGFGVSLVIAVVAGAVGGLTDFTLLFLGVAFLSLGGAFYFSTKIWGIKKKKQSRITSDVVLHHVKVEQMYTTIVREFKED